MEGNMTICVRHKGKMKQRLLQIGLIFLLSLFLVSSVLAVKSETISVGVITDVSFLQGDFSAPELTVIKTTHGAYVLWDHVSIPKNVSAYIFTTTDSGIVESWLYWNGSKTTYKLKSR
jgi:hypothetical protein